MDYRRERAPKAAVTAAIGERGRRTGALMPRYGDVPLTQDGFEDPDAYFNSGSESASQDAGSSSPQRHPQQSTSRGYASNNARVSPQRNAAATAPSQQQLLSSASRRQPRRDVTAELGVRGRRTGVTIVPAGQVARRSDGFEDMDAFFAIEPPSVPPVQRKKRISKINEDQEEEEEEEEEDDAYDQTANYGSRGVRNTSTRRYANSHEMVGEEENLQEYTNGGQDEGSEEEEDGDETRIADTTVTSTVQRRGNISRASRYADEDDDEEEEDEEANDDGGTRSMSLEGSSYFNKSTRTALSQQAASSSKVNRTTSTVLSRRSEVSQRQSVRSPSRSASQSASPPRQLQPPVASTSKQRRLSSLQADPTSSDEEERDAIQSSLTRSAQARQKRRSSAGNNDVRSRREVHRSDDRSASESPTRQQEDSRARVDLKGKGKARPTLFAPPSSGDDVEREADQTAQTSARYDDDEDDDDDGQQGGFEPAMDVDDDAPGYNDYANGDETGGYGDPNDVAPGGEYDDDDQPGYESQDDDRQDQRRRRGESDDEEEAEDEPPSRSRSLVDLEAGHDDGDDDDEDQADEQVEQYDSDQVSDELPPPLGSKAKGRGRAAANDSGLGGDAEDDEQQEERPVTPQKRGPGRPKGKGKGKAVVVGATRAGSQTAAAARKKRLIEHPDGVRRSHRDRTSPVAYWRNEHVIYRRRDSPSGAAYYEKVGVADRPRPPVRSLVNQHKRSRSASAGAGLKNANNNNNNGSPRKRIRSRSVGTDPGGPEDGVDGQGQGLDWTKWDEETDPDGIVWDYVDGQEIRRRVAFTSTMLDPKPTRHHAYKYQRVFTDGDYMAGGILIIPPTEKKPLKPARDNTYMFYCAQGAVRVLVHRTEFSVAQKGFFLIPRGNSYQINNLTDIDAVLIFMQAREVAAIADGEDGEEGAAQA